jgi:hypothetical protein
MFSVKLNLNQAALRSNEQEIRQNENHKSLNRYHYH